jgi:uncharacterized membrane protein
MFLFVLFGLTFVTIMATVYAHARLRYHTKTALRTLISHLMLLAVGIAFGYAMAAYYFAGTRTLEATLIFVFAFGLVHVPAAVILFIKRRRAQHPLPVQVRKTPAAAADHPHPGV